jgi:predicted nucleotide-binding protein
MYYHVIIETKENDPKSKKNKQYYEFDKTDIDEIKNDIIFPYLKKEEFQFNGYFLEPSNIIRLAVKQSEKLIDQLVKLAYDNLSRGVIAIITKQVIVNGDKYTKDITKQIFNEAKSKHSNNGKDKSKKQMEVDPIIHNNNVFIVHGHDDLAKIETARLITDLGFEPIILHEQASSGKTIIEKIEEYTNVGFAVVLYTPCDKGGKNTDPLELKLRARQNVVFEHGYLIGKLTRKNVCALVKGEVETPNDISGVVYITIDNHGAWKYTLAKEMANSGYSIDLNKIN